MSDLCHNDKIRRYSFLCFYKKGDENVMDKETLRLVCAPKDEASMLTQYEHFGWVMADRKEIFNSQEVFDYSTTFSYRGNSGTSIHTHNEVCHFISYLLQRNRDMDDYVNISMIEISYWNKRNEIGRASCRERV